MMISDRIKVAERIDKVCVTPDDGLRLCRMIRDRLYDVDDLFVDFTGVRYLTAPFLAAAIGRLYADLDEQEVDAHVTCGGLDELDEEILRDVRERAKRFYAMTPEQQTAVIEAEAKIFGAWY